MYKLKIRNIRTNEVSYNYGFSSYLMKRILYLFTVTDFEGYLLYEILDVIPLCFSLKTLKKCLTKYSYVSDYSTIINEMRRSK